MKLEIPQIVALAAGAGFSGDDLITAVSIALAESGGNPQAYNPERQAGTAQGYGSFGLWQIYLKKHPEFAGTNLFDPQTNASAAFAVYRQAGGSFQPWSTFKSGAYLAYAGAVGDAIAPATPANDTQVADVTGDPTATDSTNSGSGDGNPGNGGMLALVVFGGLAFWAVKQFFG